MQTRFLVRTPYGYGLATWKCRHCRRVWPLDACPEWEGCRRCANPPPRLDVEDAHAEVLAANHLGLVHHIAQRMGVPDDMEAIAAGEAALDKAARDPRFDSSKGKFSTYAGWLIRRRIMDHLNRLNGTYKDANGKKRQRAAAAALSKLEAADRSLPLNLGSFEPAEGFPVRAPEPKSEGGWWSEVYRPYDAPPAVPTRRYEGVSGAGPPAGVSGRRPTERLTPQQAAHDAVNRDCRRVVTVISLDQPMEENGVETLADLLASDQYGPAECLIAKEEYETAQARKGATMATTSNEILPRPWSRGAKYEWNSWLDGQCWVLRHGVDFHGRADMVTNAAHQAARIRGLKVRTSVDKAAGTVKVQAVRPKPEQVAA
jgi:hypothetical protein